MLLRNPAIARVTLARLIARMGGEAAFFIGVWGMAAYTFRATPGQIAVAHGGARDLVDGRARSSRARWSTASGRSGCSSARSSSTYPIVLAVTFVGSLSQLIAMCALLGLATAPIMTATSSFAPYLASETDTIEGINALIEGAGALAFVLGPALGAIVASTFSLDAVFYVDAICTTAGALLVLGVATPPVSGDEAARVRRASWKG